MKKISMECSTMLFVYLFLLSILRTSTTLDSVTPGQSVRDGQSLVSADGTFELGFFTPDNSRNRYLGIWYKKISVMTVVWVANREIPLINSSGVLSINDQGILVLQNSTEDTIWSSNSSRTVRNPVAQLLESGNLVVKDGNDNNFLWQSFDHPCDTLLPGMKLGRNLVTGLEWFLTSWKSTDDPSLGDFSCHIDSRGYPQLVVMKGSTIHYRFGSWNGLQFTGTPELKPNQVFRFEFVLNEREVHYEYELLNSSVISRLLMKESGLLQRFVWIDQTNIWSFFLSFKVDNCDEYAFCGVYASCNVENSPVCECLPGFIPKSPRDWNVLSDWTTGCVRRTQLDCENGDGFLKYTGVKLPDTSYSWFNKSMSLKECEAMCLKNCSCTAYANSDIREHGSGCVLWFGDLIDIREIINGGQDIYIKMAASELGYIEKKRQFRRKKRIGIIVSSTLILLTGTLILGIFLYIRKKKLQQQELTKYEDRTDYADEGTEEDMELPIFDLATIANATNNFSSDNKLGEGGFGVVYKGMLLSGEEIAVKRLSKSSGQGPNEFKNEVKLIAKLQHRNLVKLLGCCIQGDEKLLVYEYMPNRSLDYFVFDQTRSKLLNWHMRFQIINGVARGLLYLHQDSRLRIIHRDLKAGNVLLDNEMNPKISDFGMAKTFLGDQSVANTNRVVGTYGYMSPEYAIDGLFSVKSDVFSFGVIVLEMMSGKKNRGFFNPHHGLNLLGHAWRLWIEERPLELIDNYLLNSCALSEVLRCIHVGLLCVQQLPEDRPNMSTVVLMLGSENPLPEPKQPGFYTERNPLEVELSLPKYGSCSVNEITTTLLEAR